MCKSVNRQCRACPGAELNDQSSWYFGIVLLSCDTIEAEVGAIDSVITKFREIWSKFRDLLER